MECSGPLAPHHLRAAFRARCSHLLRRRTHRSATALVGSLGRDSTKFDLCASSVPPRPFRVGPFARTLELLLRASASLNSWCPPISAGDLTTSTELCRFPARVCKFSSAISPLVLHM